MSLTKRIVIQKCGKDIRDGLIEHLTDMLSQHHDLKTCNACGWICTGAYTEWFECSECNCNICEYCLKEADAINGDILVCKECSDKSVQK